MRQSVSGDDLKAQAVAWFGERGWQTKLAALLGVDRVTVWRYIQNDMVPGPVAAAVRCWQANGLPD
jgi:hypothetical protein